MEGKNVRTPQQQAELEDKLFPVIEKLISVVFPGGKITKGEVKQGDGKLIKIHVDEVGSDELLTLAQLVRERQAIVCLKRSGTGITIVITFARS